ncbi:MAG: triose-phosphate isomerase [Candidatus Yonathbacteria bacterium]|nr:triose-phosphate isomerase [Candidatus Yonathbacteria bacterium]
MKSKKLIIGNWKMYPASIEEARDKFTKIKKGASVLRNVQTIICPPFIYIGDLKKFITGRRVGLGVQNTWYENEGAYTGEVSPAQISSLGISSVIIGHSERRALGETDEMVNKKVSAALKAGLAVILCVGESERDRDGHYLKHIDNQIRIALRAVSRKDLPKIIIAYEPIWAIGKNALRAASAEDALEVSILIKKTLTSLYKKNADNVRILYGGSVNGKNAQEFLCNSQIDGLLVGRASLNPIVFSEILKSAENIK